MMMTSLGVIRVSMLNDERPNAERRMQNANDECVPVSAFNIPHSALTKLHVFLDQLLERVLVGEADDLFDELSALEQQERRDAADAETPGDARIVVHVQLADDHTAIVIGGE